MKESEKNNFAKKLLYQSVNRGYKENEVILGNFARNFLSRMSLEEMCLYEKILQESDADLYDWLTHKSAYPARLDSEIMSNLLNFKINY